MNETLETLFQQLGGGHFVVMTGAKIMTDGPNTMVIKLTRMSKIAGMSIRYDAGTDTYAVTPIVGHGMRQRLGEEILDVHVGELLTTFEQLTGLYTHL